MYPEVQSLYLNPGPNPGLSVARTAGVGYPPSQGCQVTVAGLSRLCGDHRSSNHICLTLSQAPFRRVIALHFQLSLHPVENLVDILLGHLAFLCQLGSLHRGASTLQRLQDPLLQVWERGEGQGENGVPRLGPGLEALEQGRPTGEGPGAEPEQTSTNDTSVQ